MQYIIIKYITIKHIKVKYVITKYMIINNNNCAQLPIACIIWMLKHCVLASTHRHYGSTGYLFTGCD